MGLECGSIKDLEGLGGRIGWLGRNTVGVGMEESQLISEFADCPFS